MSMTESNSSQAFSRDSLNLEANTETPSFPEKVTTESGEYRRDDKARKIGGQWISGADRKKIQPVPANINVSLRRWNGLSSRTREQLTSMLTEMDKDTLKDVSRRSKDQWEEIIIGFANPQKKLARHFLKARPRRDLDPNDLMSYVMELDNLGFTNATEDENAVNGATELRQPMATRMEAWRISKNKQKENPSYSLMAGPRLEESELEEWADAASIGIASSLRDATDVLELSMNDKLPDNLFDRIARRFLTEQEPPFSSFDDFEMVVDIVKNRFGYPTSLEAMMDEGAVSEKDQDMIISGKLADVMQMGDMATLDPAEKKSSSAVMELLNIRSDVPSEIPNASDSENFKPYISPKI